MSTTSELLKIKTLDSTLLKIIAKPELFNEITLGHNVLAILLGGSRLVGVENDMSDYDLTVVVSRDDYLSIKKIFNNFPTYKSYFYISGVKVHWTYTNIDTLTSFPKEWWPIETFYLWNNSLIYVEDLEILEKMYLKLKKMITKNLKILYESHQYLNSIQDISTILEFKTKKIYRYCLLACLLKNSEITSMEVTKLKELHDIYKNNKSYLGISHQLDNWAISKLKWLYKYIKELY